MPIELKMPALSPTMESGTLAKWLVSAGDHVRAGDIMAEIETDKATMEYEAVDEGTVAAILVPEGTDVQVGAVIALLACEGEKAPAPEPKLASSAEIGSALPAVSESEPEPARPSASRPIVRSNASIAATPLAKRLAEQKGIDLAAVTGSGANGRIVMADLGLAPHSFSLAMTAPAGQVTPAAAPVQTNIPHDAAKLSNMRRTIARRLTGSKQTVPHIYLTVEVVLDALLKLRSELNATLSARGIKLTVNDMLIKALGVALRDVPTCNVEFAGDQLLRFRRADIAVAVSMPAGLITPIVVDADTKSLSAIAIEMKDLAARARDGKLRPDEYQGGTASLSNMGMFGIRQFEAVINPPQGMIMAIGAGEKRPWAIGDSLGVATVMSATGSFDHRAIDGADGAQLMKRFKELVESPLGAIA